jgi:hypothetical protein
MGMLAMTPSRRRRVAGTFFMYFSVSGSVRMRPASMRFTLRAAVVQRGGHALTSFSTSRASAPGRLAVEVTHEEARHALRGEAIVEMSPRYSLAS